MAGQLSHFVNYAQQPVPYAQARYAKEYDRLLAVMDLRLRNRDFLAGDYSIADMAAFPWVLPHQRYGQDLQRFENLRRWLDAIRSRPAVQRAVAVGEDWPRDEAGNDRAHATLFGQDSATVFEAARKLQLDP
jgi:GST-like protein